MKNTARRVLAAALIPPVIFYALTEAAPVRVVWSGCLLAWLVIAARLK